MDIIISYFNICRTIKRSVYQTVGTLDYIALIPLTSAILKRESRILALIQQER